MRTADPAHPIRALVAQDAARDPAELVHILQADNDIIVVGCVTGTAVLPSTLGLRPDVIIFDGQRGGRANPEVIGQIMSQAPTPILVLSGPEDGGRSPAVVEALVAGALDALPIPATWTPELRSQLRRTVRVVFGVHVIRHARPAADRADDRSPSAASPHRVVVIGASTGGPSAVATVLAGLGGLTAPVLVVQHLHVDFTAGLVEWMARVSALPVELAEHGQRARGGRVYFAPGGVHLRLGAASLLQLDAAPASLHRPSVDQLFQSAADHAGASAIGVLMTGMGDDGAQGLLAIHRRGGHTLGQDEASCAVFGMPAAAQRLGAVSEMLPPEGLAKALVLSERTALR